MTGPLEYSPYTPVELHNPVHDGQPYLSYWKQYREDGQSVRGTDEVGQMAVAGMHYVRDDGIMPEFPECLVPAGMETDRVEVIEKWARSLGPFNSLQDARGDLLRGAAIVLQENNLETEEFPVVATPNPRTVCEAFLDVVDQLGDMSCQQPTHALLVAGELVEQAGFATTDREVRTDLLHGARRMFKRLHADPDREWDIDQLRAGQHYADLRFEEIDDKLQRTLSRGGKIDPIRRQATTVLEGQIRDVLRSGSKIESGKLARTWTGPIFESVIQLAVRHVGIYDAENTDSFEVVDTRVSCIGEDRPFLPIGRRYESSFDLVFRRYDEAGRVVEAEPWQLKYGDSLIHNPKQYHPVIRIVEAPDLPLYDMIQAVKAMRNLYNANDNANRSAIARVTSLVTRLIDQDLAA